MGDKTNYQAMRFDPHPTQRMVDACCARIAEMERGHKILDAQREKHKRAREQAEAALAEATKVLRYGEEKDLPMLYSESQAALAERDQTIERLKCCGNCSFWLAVLEDCPVKDEPYADRFDRCHITPSKWTARAEEGSGR